MVYFRNISNGIGSDGLVLSYKPLQKSVDGAFAARFVEVPE
jgi:hypothetical protein